MPHKLVENLFMGVFAARYVPIPAQRARLGSELVYDLFHLLRAHAKEFDALAVIDDEVARKTAKVYRINYGGTPYILARAVFEEIISKEQAKLAVNDMVSAGWRCSVESYAKIMELLEK